MIEKKILPYFGKRKIADIEAKDVIAWQNELMKYRDEKGKPYSGDYLKTIHAQLTAIFNHAVNFYNLPYNPAKRAGCMKSTDEQGSGVLDEGRISEICGSDDG